MATEGACFSTGRVSVQHQSTELINGFPFSPTQAARGNFMSHNLQPVRLSSFFFVVLWTNNDSLGTDTHAVIARFSPPWTDENVLRYVREGT